MGVLEGRAGFVTGGGRGIGRGHCLHLAQQGAGVVVNDVDLDEADKVVAEVREQGGRAVASDADIGGRKGARSGSSAASTSSSTTPASCGTARSSR